MENNRYRTELEPIRKHTHEHRESIKVYIQ